MLTSVFHWRHIILGPICNLKLNATLFRLGAENIQYEDISVFSICILCVLDHNDLKSEFERSRTIGMITVTGWILSNFSRPY